MVAGDPGGGSGLAHRAAAGSGGHFSGLGTINGHSVQFVIDTGATTVAMGGDVAQQLGLDPRTARRWPR